MLCLTNQNIKTPKLNTIIRYLTDNLDAVGKMRYEVNNLRDARLYRWLELPQVSFLSRQIFCRNKHVFVETKHVFCRDKSMHVATKLLSRQTRVCRDKHNFIATSVRLSRQKHVCRNKSMLRFVATKIILMVAPANFNFPPLFVSDMAKRNLWVPA